jgi:hypothetical protein
MARRNQAVFNAVLCAFLVKSMIASWLFFLTGKAVGELCAVVGEDFLDEGLQDVSRPLNSCRAGVFAVSCLERQVQANKGKPYDTA